MTSLEDLLKKIDEAMKRDITAILVESTRGKLSATSARDLVQYRKLITDTMLEEEKAKKKLPEKTEDELREMAKELLNSKESK